MALGTGAIKLSQVTAEIAGAQTKLSQCFTDACSAGFNLTYSKSGQWLSEFRGYNDASCGASIVVSPPSYNAPVGGGTSIHSVTANVSWTVTDNASWVSVSPTSGSNNGSITITVQANLSGASRNAVVTVSGGGTSDTVSIFQFG